MDERRDQLLALKNIEFPGFASPGQRHAHGMPAWDLPQEALAAINDGRVSWYQGKVRDSFLFEDSILMVTSDRVSAFDRILDVVPGKGEILNRISRYWFEQTKDIVANHVLEVPGGRSLLAKRAQVLPVEVVVRGYLTGSAWRDYQKGRDISGIHLPAGMAENQKLDAPIITPSTKADVGLHDQPISSEEIVSRGLVEAELWHRVCNTALKLFQRGSELVARQGLLLVDTKYEFGLADGKLLLVDEIHTPDSSRYWYADSYDADFSAGASPAKLDKEYLRRWLMNQGFSGDGAPPTIPAQVKDELSMRYLKAYELITGEQFFPMFPHIQSELEKLPLYF